jgi:VCBS repeat-containing protein
MTPFLPFWPGRHAAAHPRAVGVGHPIRGGDVSHIPVRTRLNLLALEPRMLFDGAGGAAADPTLVAHPDTQTVDDVGHKATGNVVKGTDGNGADTGPNSASIHVQKVWAGTGQAPHDADVGKTIDGAYGRLTLNDDGSYTYVPFASTSSLPNGVNQSDVFSYTIRDGSGNTATTTLTITVRGTDLSPKANQQAQANPDERDYEEGGIQDGEAIKGDNKGDNADDPPTASVIAAGPGLDPANMIHGAYKIKGTYGDLTLYPDGHYTYVLRPDVVPPEGAKDSFSYKISDGGINCPYTHITINFHHTSPPPGTGTPPVPPVPPGTSLPPTPLDERPPPPSDRFTGVTPLYSAVSSRYQADLPLMTLPDGFNLANNQQVKGVVEEKDTSSMREERPKAKDDCVPEHIPPRKEVVKDSHVHSPTRVLPKTLVEPARPFSEQVQGAHKRFKPPAKVKPAVVPQRIC